ncbi:hypothetical protein VTJ04DRAFT_8999 [Mycothermus thermophilus]|uniref:uncharacterized protein n=1 Tax=Humicola insolens TaxID=85995 RepID=UPI0037438BEC
MAPSSHIIRIPRTDEDGSFVLGEVTPSGSKPLNLKLVATEGEEPYVLKLRHDRIGDLRASNNPCSLDEWEKILKSFLLGDEPVEGVEAGAESSVGKAIVITIRRRVAGISQRLGSLTLSHKPDEAIQLFDWCGAAIEERERLRSDLRASDAKAASLEAQVAELRAQLEELTEAKTAREAELLEKFCALLNEKKVKIREQQRLLSAAKVDPSRLDVARAAQATTTSTTTSATTRGRSPKAAAGPSRDRKRKSHSVGGEDSGSESGSDFEPVTSRPGGGGDRMDLDDDVQETPESRVIMTPEVPETQGSDDRETTTDDEATASGSEDEAPLPPPKTRQQEKQSRTSAGKGKATVTGTSKAETSTRKDMVISPVKKPARKPPAKAATPPAGESETESDDEL